MKVGSGSRNSLDSLGGFCSWEIGNLEVVTSITLHGVNLEGFADIKSTQTVLPTLSGSALAVTTGTGSCFLPQKNNLTLNIHISPVDQGKYVFK